MTGGRPRPDATAGVVVLGSANVDLVATAERHPMPGETVLGLSFAEHPGGKGLNQAVAAARSGATTKLVAAVGTDPAGGTLLDVAAAAGVLIDDCVRRADHPTGRALITVDRHGENSIVVVPGANATMPAMTGELGGTVLLAQLEVPIESVAATFAAARRRGLTTVLNPAPAAAIPEDLLGDCDIVVPNQHEVDRLGGVQHLLDLGVSAVIVTLGADGVLVADRSGRRIHPAWEVDPVDTTGAGDTFCGALAARIAMGDPLPAAVDWAAAAAALSTTIDGAVPSIPTAEAVDHLIATGRRRA